MYFLKKHASIKNKHNSQATCLNYSSNNIFQKWNTYGMYAPKVQFAICT